MIAYRMHLIRTGKTTTGKTKLFVGQGNPPLCPEGVEELERLRREYEYPSAQAVFTSPLLRCTQTADMLFPDRYTEEVEGLMDMDLGDFTGKNLEELRGDRAFEDWLQNARQNPPPGGEDSEQFTRRIIGAVDSVFRRMMEERLQNVAVITHGGVLMALLAGIGMPRRPLHEWACPNGMGYTLLFTPQLWMRDGIAEVFAPVPDTGESGFDEF